MFEPTVSAVLEALAGRAPDQLALQLVGPGASTEACTFRELADRSSRLAKSFRALGLRAGDCLAIWLPNRPLWLIAHFAAARAGVTTIPLNTWYRESEVEHFLELSSARALIMDSAAGGAPFGEIVRSVWSSGSSLEWVIDVAGSSSDNHETLKFISLNELEPGSSEPFAIEENSALIAFSTSGTTAMPKLAVHRESAPLTHASAIVQRAGITPSDVVLGALPLCGAYGYTLLLSSLLAQARAVQLERFDLDDMIDVIEREKVSVMALTEPIMRSLLDHPRATATTLASLRLVFSAGSTLQPVVERAEEEFGFTVTNVYGSSEVLALAAFWDDDEPAETRGAAGGELVHPGMEVSVVDTAGEPVASEPGELRFRGAALTIGYLRNSGATATAFSQNGWFSSGDLGTLVEGNARRFRYLARMGDALRLRGFLVNPAEIEGRLQKHPEVMAAQVVGIQAQDGEDRAVAFVTLQEGANVSAADLQMFCREKMASYKVPADVRIIEDFPTTLSANGDKVLKSRLREMAEELNLDG